MTNRNHNNSALVVSPTTTKAPATSPPTTSSSTTTASVPSTIYTTFLHRRTKETCTYTYQKEEETTIMTNSFNTTTTSTSSSSSTSGNNVKEEGLPSSSPPPVFPNRNTTTNKPEPEQEPEQEPYQELKWNHAPLFLNDGFGNPNELLLKDKQALPIHAGRTALLVVDVQPEYWSHCPAVRQDFPDFPSNIRTLVQQCRQQKAKIIWVRADYRYAHSPWLVQFARLHQGRIPSEVVSDASHQDDIEWEDFATPEGGEYVIPKTSWSSTRHTALMDLLKQSGIDTVLVCGLITSVCVQHSAFGIFEAGYRTLLVTDACADRGKARHDAALALYGDYMYELLTVHDLCDPTSALYLRKAKPVWLTPDSISNLVQPQFFNNLQDSVVTKVDVAANEDEDAVLDDSRTTMTSNKSRQLQQELQEHLAQQQQHQEAAIHPTFYKVEEPNDPSTSTAPATNTSSTSNAVPSVVVQDPTVGVMFPSADKSMTNSTARTSTSSLTTLFNSPLASPVLESVCGGGLPSSSVEGGGVPMPPPDVIQV